MDSDQLKAFLLRPLNELQFDGQEKRIRDAFGYLRLTHGAHLYAVSLIEFRRIPNFGKETRNHLDAALAKEGMPPLGAVKFESDYDVRSMSFDELQEFLGSKPAWVVPDVIAESKITETSNSSAKLKHIISTMLPERWNKLNDRFARAVQSELAIDPEVKQCIEKLEATVLQVVADKLPGWMLSGEFSKSSQSAQEQPLAKLYTAQGWILKFVPSAFLKSGTSDFKKKASDSLISDKAIIAEVQALEQCVRTKLGARMAKEFN